MCACTHVCVAWQAPCVQLGHEPHCLGCEAPALQALAYPSTILVTPCTALATRAVLCDGQGCQGRSEPPAGQWQTPFQLPSGSLLQTHFGCQGASTWQRQKQAGPQSSADPRSWLGSGCVSWGRTTWRRVSAQPQARPAAGTAAAQMRVDEMHGIAALVTPALARLSPWPACLRPPAPQRSRPEPAKPRRGGTRIRTQPLSRGARGFLVSSLHGAFA